MAERTVSKIVGLDALPRESRELFEEVIVHASLKAIITGAVLSGPYVRALLLAHSETSLLRVSPVLSAEQRAALLSILERAAIPYSSWGEMKGRVWARRKFYDRTFEEVEPVRRTVGLAKTRELAATLLRLHEGGGAHGHIAWSNLVQDEGALRFVDPGWAWLSGEGHGVLPPEYQAGASPQPATDGYAFAKLLPQLLGAEMDLAIQNGLLAFETVDPRKRPSFQQLMTLLGAEVPAAPSPITSRGGGILLGQTGSAPRGRVIEPTVQPPQPTAAAPVEDATVHARSVAAETTVIQPQVVNPVDKIPLDSGAGPTSSRGWPRPLGLLVLVLIACLATIFWYQSRNVPTTADSELVNFWSGSAGSGHRYVAELAVAGDEHARKLILQEATSGDPRPFLRVRILRVSFHPLWAKQLGPIDTRVAFALGLAPLVPVQAEALPPIEDLHPGVQLAMVADLPLETSSPILSRVKVSRLATLPGVIGQTFGALQGLSVTDISNPVARSLAKIVTEEHSHEVLMAFLAPLPEGGASAEHRLRLLLGVAAGSRPLLSALIVAMPNVKGDLGLRSRWFADSEVKWDDVAAEVVLGLIAGIHPRLPLAFEQEADLLGYPEAGVRSAAAEQLLKSARSESERAVVRVISQQPGTLSRFQVVSLLTGLRLSGDHAYSFLVSWFETTPDPPTVARLLAERGVTKELDPFAVEAARYLKNQQWNLPAEELRRLSLHPEALVRALVYSRLDPMDEKHRSILNDMLRVEPNAKIRAQLEQKLKIQ